MLVYLHLYHAEVCSCTYQVHMHMLLTAEQAGGATARATLERSRTYEVSATRYTTLRVRNVPVVASRSSAKRMCAGRPTHDAAT